jgi:hypothetical protein
MSGKRISKSATVAIAVEAPTAIEPIAAVLQPVAVTPSIPSLQSRSLEFRQDDKITKTKSDEGNASLPNTPKRAKAGSSTTPGSVNAYGSAKKKVYHRGLYFFVSQTLLFSSCVSCTA